MATRLGLGRLKHVEVKQAFCTATLGTTGTTNSGQSDDDRAVGRHHDKTLFIPDVVNLGSENWLDVDPVRVLAKPITVLDKLRSARSLEESSKRIGVWQHRNQSTPRCSTAADQKEKCLGGNAQVERIQCVPHGYPGVIIAAREARVREDLTTLPEESGSWASSSPLRSSSKLARGSSWWPQETSTRAESADSNASTCATLSDPRDARDLEKDRSTDCATPTRRPLVARRSFRRHRMAQGSGCARGAPCSRCLRVRIK